MNGEVNGTTEDHTEALSKISNSKVDNCAVSLADTAENDSDISKNSKVSPETTNNLLKVKETVLPDSKNSLQNDEDEVNLKTSSPPENILNKNSNIDCNLKSSENLCKVDDKDESPNEENEILTKVKQVDSVSINSDSESDDSSHRNQKNKDSDVILVDNKKRQNGKKCSPEIHEILSDNDNDDCIVTNEEMPHSKIDTPKRTLRRSSRSIKKTKKYNIDSIENGKESDIEEIELEDPLKRKLSKSMVISNSKEFLTGLTVKRIKIDPGDLKKYDNALKSNGSVNQKNQKSSIISVATAQSLYQSIVGHNTTVTPVPNKVNIINQASTPLVQPILPSLTDDMFVVEAPSFIVPYVYEKPSIKPFREFVDILGRELEEQKAIEEQEKIDKDKDFINQNKDKLDAKDTESEAEPQKDSDKEEEKKKKKSERREKHRRNKDCDDESWSGDSIEGESSESDESENENENTVVIKDKIESIDDIKNVTELTAEKVVAGKADNYFSCSLGNFFINIGLNLVQEFVQNDLLKTQNRKLYREKKSGNCTKLTLTSIASLTKNLQFSKENNAPYSFPQKKCEHCSFKTESLLVMAHHLETPHMKNNLYKCNFCTFEVRSPNDILLHMENKHKIKGRLERAPACHQCPNCPFEDNGKGKLARHQLPCARKFKPELNLAPPGEWEPPAKIPKITKSRNMMNSYQNAFNKHIGNTMNRPTVNSNNTLNAIGAGFKPRGRSPLALPARGVGASIVRGVTTIRQNTPTPVLMPSNFPVTNNDKKSRQLSISITPLPQQTQALQTHAVQPGSKSTFVICEICDGYIKDLEQLRNHMQWIHKVKIHPKMIYNRPPLNCQKCQFRFFTDQGLERHLLGSHGLVTSSMQQAANKGNDAGRCPVCGRVYQWKLLNHVARDHHLTLKPAHLSYKCTVCTATFSMYKQFESHVYSAHSVVAKRVMDKNKAPATKANDLAKPLKINDEITITPQPVKATAASVKEK